LTAGRVPVEGAGFQKPLRSHSKKGTQKGVASARKTAMSSCLWKGGSPLKKKKGDENRGTGLLQVTGLKGGKPIEKRNNEIP